jgi:GNAT superfamily N-acetyltransferase
LDVRIVPLDDSHDRAAFSCGKPSIDAFLHNAAPSRAARFLAATRVAVATDPGCESEILGYYTLVTHEYRDDELPSHIARKLGVKGLNRVPMILLAQLGVRKDIAGHGLGKTLMRNALELSLLLARSASSIAVITDPIDEAAATYYITKFGFAEIGVSAVSGQPRLFLSMKTIEMAYRTATKTSI